MEKSLTLITSEAHDAFQVHMRSLVDQIRASNADPSEKEFLAKIAQCASDMNTRVLVDGAMLLREQEAGMSMPDLFARAFATAH